MDNHMEKPLRRYMRETKRLLTCPQKYRSDFMADMEKDIQQFLLENNSAGYNDIIDYFGTPAKLAHLYLENVPPEELVTYTIKKRRCTRLIYISLFLMLTATILGLYAKLQEPRELDVIYMEESIWEMEK